MSTQLSSIQSELATTSEFADFLNLKQRLQDFKFLRSQLLTVDKELDALLKESLQVIDLKIKKYQEEHKEDLTKDIEQNLIQITEYMNGIDYLPQITSVYATDLRKSTESLLGYTDSEESKKYKKAMQQIVSTRQSYLTKQMKDIEKTEQQLQEDSILEIKNNLTSLV